MMVVELQTSEGDIKEYRTVYFKAGFDADNNSEGGPHHLQIYCTNCGREWIEEPQDHEECNHVECAINSARKRKKDGPAGSMIGILIAAVSLILGGIIMAEKDRIWSLSCSLFQEHFFH